MRTMKYCTVGEWIEKIWLYVSHLVTYSWYNIKYNYGCQNSLMQMFCTVCLNMDIRHNLSF